MKYHPYFERSDSLSPNENRVVVPPRQAYSHSDSLGKRRSAFLSHAVTSFQLTLKTDGVSLTVRATDDDGRVGRRQVELRCGSKQTDFLVRTDKAVYRGGETIDLLALGGGRESVFVDLIKDGQTILTETIDMVDGRGDYQFDLPPDVFGTLELVAYRFGASGLPVRKSRVLYVHQAEALTIEAALDHNEYRPGRDAKLTLTVKDVDGRPVPGAVSLAAVDEAGYAAVPVG